MRLKKAIKRIVALGAGATMLGATIMGAMAADLADYPEPFVKDGLWQSDALIVFGTNAAASDVAGSVDLAVTLQYAARTKKTVSTAAAGAITITGDAKKIAKSTNNLEFTTNESVSDIQASVTSADLTALADGSISNEYGTPTYTQTIYLPNNGSLVFAADPDDDTSAAKPYLKITSDSNIKDNTYKYEISFSPSLKSDHHAAGSSYLNDIRNKKIKILGQDYTIIQADHSAHSNIALTFMAGAVADTMSEGETKTYTIEGVDYEVTLDYVGSTEVKFTVNGETTLALAETETHRLADGTEIGIVDIMAQEFAGGLRKVEFNLGANKIKCHDANASNSTTQGIVTIGSEDMSSVKCDITLAKDEGVVAGDDVEITTIDFYYSAGSDLYLAAGESGADKAETAEAQAGNFLNKAFDFKFEGLEVGKTENIELTSSGSYNYKLKFTNKAGVSYNQEVFALDSTVKFGRFTGSTMYDIINNEVTAITDEKYFIVSKNEYSRIMQFKDLVPGASTTDNVGTIRIKDTGTGDLIDVAYSGSAREGYLRLDGNEFKLNVSADTNAGVITVDFDGGGSLSDAAMCPQLFSQYGANITLCGWANVTSPSTPAGFIGPGYGENALAITTEILEGGSSREIIVIGVIINSDSKIDLNDSAVVHSLTVTGPTYHTTSMAQEKDGSYLYQWYSRYGAQVEVDRIGSGATQNNFKVVYPDDQMFGAFFVVSGETTVSAVEAGEGVVTYYETNPIGVGMAKLASDVADMTAYNLLLVGGPCANEAARTIMGVTEATCLEGFEAGKALLKIYDNDGKVALLVAGYSADDTIKATTVLANWDQYVLSGTEMEVTGTSLTELTVAAPTPAEEAAEETTEEEE